MAANVIDELDDFELEPPTHFTRAADERVNWLTSIPFFLVHLAPLLWFVTGITWTAVALFFVTYFGRMFFLTATYHRYFSHKSFRLNRGVGIRVRVRRRVGGPEGSVVVGRTPPQPSQVLRHRTRVSILLKRGFWWSHVGWSRCDKYGLDQVDARHAPQSRPAREVRVGAGVTSVTSRVFVLPLGRDH